MRTYLDCYPCLVRHAIEAARLTSVDTGRQEELVQHVLRRVAAVTPPHTPVRFTAEIHELIRAFLGVSDPYARIKQKANQAALDMLPDLRRRCTAAPDRLQTAARMAIAGNIIDHGSLGEAYDLPATLDQCLTSPLGINDFESFRSELNAARHIVYVGDNAGEIAFDRLFIEEIRNASAANIAFIVRGSPILNDVTAVDAEVVGLTDWVRVVASGEGAPGCELDRSPPEVCALFDSADLIISKGQGNYEALSDEPYPIYFFLKVKCPVIERDIGARKGDSVLKRSDRKGR
jgi:damage-control phosphatase, subfamily I